MHEVAHSVMNIGFDDSMAVRLPLVKSLFDCSMCVKFDKGGVGFVCEV